VGGEGVNKKKKWGGGSHARAIKGVRTLNAAPSSNLYSYSSDTILPTTRCCHEVELSAGASVCNVEMEACLLSLASLLQIAICSSSGRARVSDTLKAEKNCVRARGRECVR